MRTLCRPSAHVPAQRHNYTMKSIGIFLRALLITVVYVPAPSYAQSSTTPFPIELGPRPFWLAEALPEGELKEALVTCNTDNISRQSFSIGHRGAPLRFPEHTKESYVAAARMGAGVIECDVSFTRDEELVCRHSQCDLHTTTNILETELAQQCSTPPDPDSRTPYADVQCCTTDVTLEEFLTLEGTMNAGDRRGTVMTHAQSIQLLNELGVDMTPELKKVINPSPHITFPRSEQADRMLEEYREAGVDSSRVWPQSFEEEDIRHWIATAPDFAEQVVYLDDRYSQAGFDPMLSDTWKPDMTTLVKSGVRWLAPPLWVLVTAEDGQMVPSTYAREARLAGLGLITWTLERSGPLTADNRGGWYYQSVAELVDDESDALQMLDVLARDVGVRAVFSDWPATTSYYAHCRP